MKKEKILGTLEEIKVISDPFRFKILALFNQDSGTAALTVKQMSLKLNEVSSKVHYHVKELERIGILEIVETKEKGGVIEKYYLPTAEIFRVKKDILIQAEAEYKQVGENLITAMYEDYVEAIYQNNNDKRQLNYGMTYLTDEEVEQLGELIAEFMKDKDARENAKPYMFGYALFQK